MLTAIQKDGTPFHLLPRLSKEMLRKERERGEFYCPECGEKVVMKVGTQRMEHFAHQTGSICVESYERESDYHVNGKMQLFSWLKTQQLQPELEPFYDRIRQRPDIGVSYGKKNYALEFQCSTIPLELIQQRTNRYKKNGYHPIWIMGGKNIKRKGEKKVSLSSFDYFFLTKTTAGVWFLPSYCPESKRFILLTNITPITSKNILTQFIIPPMQQFPFAKLMNPSETFSIASEVWKREIRAQKLSIQMSRNYQNEFLRELYSCSLNVSLLPPMVGLPVSNAPMIETSPLIWQTYVFIDHFYCKKENERITFGAVYRSFMERVRRNQIKLRCLPLLPDSNPIFPLAEYLQLLVRLNVLEALNYNTFCLRNKINISEHIVMQQEKEDCFYKEYRGVIFHSNGK